MLRTIHNNSKKRINITYELELDDNTPTGFFTCEFENTQVNPLDITEMMVTFKGLNDDESIEYGGKISVFTNNKSII